MIINCNDNGNGIVMVMMMVITMIVGMGVLIGGKYIGYSLYSVLRFGTQRNC